MRAPTVDPVTELVFVGTGEALDPELPNTSLLVRGPATLLLDCGYSVPHALWRITRDVDLLDGVWVSHVHADHAFGLPALLLWMRLGGRTRPLSLLCGPGQAAKLDAILELGYPGSFAAAKCYAIDRIELDPGRPQRWGGFEARIAASRHSVPNSALRLDAPGLRSLVYSGDGAPTPQTLALCRGASILVHECFTPVPATTPKHGDVESCVALARAAGVETLALLHFASDAKLDVTQAAKAQVPPAIELLMPSPGDRLSLTRGNPG